ncbi:MAG: hypothetical protein WC243_01325 [Patescibacteria group bacterium]|jgi:hypothetical protein
MDPRAVLDTAVKKGSCVIYPWNRRSFFEGWRDARELIDQARREEIFSISYVRGTGDEIRPCTWWRANGIKIATDMRQICRRYNNAMRAMAERLWCQYFEPELSGDSHKGTTVSIPRSEFQDLVYPQDRRRLTIHLQGVARKHGATIFICKPRRGNGRRINEPVPSVASGLGFDLRVR